jgi:hypothetical protein
MVALSELFNLSPEALAMRRRDALANMPPTEFINPPVDPFQLAALKRRPPGGVFGEKIGEFTEGAGALGGGPGRLARVKPTSPVPQVGKRQVLDVELGGRATGGKAIAKGPSVEVNVNPSRGDIKKLLSKSTKLSKERNLLDEPVLRYSVHPDTKELHVWIGSEATHNAIGAELRLPTTGESVGFIQTDPTMPDGFAVRTGFGSDISEDIKSVEFRDFMGKLSEERTIGETFPGAEAPPDKTPKHIIEANEKVQVRDHVWDEIFGHMRKVDAGITPDIDLMRLKGTAKRFWGGVFDVRDGKILEVVQHKVAAQVDFHHSEYVSDKADREIGKGNADLFFMNRKGEIETTFKQEVSKRVIGLLEEQIDKLKPPKKK